MNDDPTKVKVAAKQQSGLHNDFSEQEAEMTASAMPPIFGLKAGAASPNPGDEKPGDKDSVPEIPGIPKEAVLELKKHEGLRMNVYKDSLGIPTAGIGHKMLPSELKQNPLGSKVTMDQVKEWAAKDMSHAWQAALAQCAAINVQNHAFTIALFSVNYQLGTNWNAKFSKTWDYMQKHEWENAAQEAARSKWNAQTPNRVQAFQSALRSLNSSPKVTHSKTPAQSPKAEVQPQAQGTDRIKQVQQRLKAMGLYPGTIDGKEFRTDGKESQTTKGIKQFQQRQGMKVTGKLDEATFQALMKGGFQGLSLFGTKPEAKQQPKQEGMAAPFKRKVEEAKAKAGEGKETSEGNAKATGNFMDDKYWRSQLNNGEVKSAHSGGTNCRYVATEMLLEYLKGEKPEMLEELGLNKFLASNSDMDDMQAKDHFLRIVAEDKSHRNDPEMQEKDHFKKENWLVDHDQAAKAIAYIDSYLQKKVPVLVGVDHTYNRKLGSKAKGTSSKASKTGEGYNEGTTDHFITLSGIGYDEATGKKYYNFMDPGRKLLKSGAGGKNSANRLSHAGGTRFVALNAAGKEGHQFHLSMVVLFPSDRGKFSKEINENKSSWVN